MLPRYWILLFAAALVAAGCGQRSREERAQPIGGEAALDASLKAARHRAAPEGAVLVVFWTTATPPTAAVGELAERWSPYGLATLGICLDLVEGGGGDEALASVREWEQSHRIGMPSLLYEGGRAALEARLGDASAGPGLLLLDPDGKRIWADASFEDVEGVDAILQVRLGLPPLADAEEGCVC